MKQKERLDVLLVQRGLCDSRSRAQGLIMSGEVYVSGQKCDKAGTPVDVEAEMSRLTITVKDIDLVNADVLKANGANGVYLMGNKVKCSFGDKAEEISKLLK